MNAVVVAARAGPRTDAPPDPDATAALTALSRLSRHYRAVIVCRVMFELSTLETAAQLARYLTHPNYRSS